MQMHAIATPLRMPEANADAAAAPAPPPQQGRTYSDNFDPKDWEKENFDVKLDLSVSDFIALTLQ